MSPGDSTVGPYVLGTNWNGMGSSGGGTTTGGTGGDTGGAGGTDGGADGAGGGGEGDAVSSDKRIIFSSSHASSNNMGPPDCPNIRSYTVFTMG